MTPDDPSNLRDALDRLKHQWSRMEPAEQGIFALFIADGIMLASVVLIWVGRILF